MLQQQFIDKWLDDRMADIKVIANDPAHMTGDKARIQQLMALVKENHREFRSIGLVGRDGKTSDGRDLRDRPYYQAAMQGAATVSDVLASRVDGKRIIVFASPVVSKEHSFQGVIMGTVELTTIEQLMRRFTYGEQGQTYVVNRDGTLITGEGSGAANPLRIHDALLEKAKAGRISLHAYNNYLGVSVYGAYLWTKNGSWLIIGEAAKADVLSALYTELRYASLFILLAMLAAVLVMLRTSKRISSPVNQLLRGVRIIRDGDYHYRIDPGVLASSTIEFQQLGQSFNAMSDTIRERSEALSQERNFASSIIDTAASLIVVLDRDGGMLRFNRSCEQATGYSFDEVRNASIYDMLIPPEEEESVRSHFRALLSAGGSYRNENHWRTRSGELRLIAWSNTIVQEPNGNVKHIIGIGIDITEQRKVERALGESEERFRLIVGSMEEVVATYDAELKLTGVYGRSMNDSGQAFGAVQTGMKVRQPMGADNADLHEQAMRLALREKTNVIEWSAESSEGAPRSYQTSYSTLRDNSEIMGVVAVSRDITQLKSAEEAYRESQARITNILESITDAFMALNYDWTLAYVNSEAESMLGRSRSQIMGKLLWDVFPDMADSPMRECCRQAMEKQMPVSTEDYVPHLKAWYSVHIYPSKVGLSIYLQDITVRKELEQTAAESRLRLTSIIETVPSGIIVVDQNGQIVVANRMAEEIYGMSKEEIISHPYDSRIWKLSDFAGNPLPVEDYPVSIAIRTGLPVSNSEYIFRRPNGESAMISCNCSPLFDHEGNVTSVLVSLSDITGRIATQTELRAANDELRKLSSLDGLTGIFNRRYFNEQLRAEWNTHTLRKEPLSLIMLDIDYFKAYNDTYGHLGGDMCLKTVASTIRSSLKKQRYFVARYGGEEFGIVLPGASLDEAASLAESLRERIESKEISHANSKVSRYVTISLGVASFVPKFGSEEDALVAAADKCLYEAKRTRNRVVAHENRSDREKVSI